MKSFLRGVNRSDIDVDKWRTSRFPLVQSLTLRRNREDRIIRVFHKETNQEVYYLVKETIATGATAKVKRALKYAEKRKTLPKEVAIKIFKVKSNRTTNIIPNNSSQIEQDFIREANILEYLSRPKNRHPNIIKLHDVLRNVELKSKHGINSSYEKKLITGLVLEFIDGGELYNYLSTSTGIPMNIEFVRAVFQQLVRALSHLHAHNIVHLDIKPENVLLNKTGMVMLTDFGSSQKLSKNKNQDVFYESKEQMFSSEKSIPRGLDKNVKVREGCAMPPEVTSNKFLLNPESYMPKSKSMVHLEIGPKTSRRRSLSKRRTLIVKSSGGTLKYRAPEVVDNEPFDGASADIWSLGVVLHVMIFNRVPDMKCLERQNSAEFVHALSRSSSFTEAFSVSSTSDDAAIKELAADLLKRMCCLDPAKRW
eukprot:CAMPEP_0184043596 /NCGR_PEP_ID=MMETSP0955-20130417/67004_1 /TAXON_ID=627963 /ORGANISM="Aplanochytrium sp, Strain PBS07" /LENGTH=422 /DNA_ID=CAMNT_0026334519 /DNA_START=241 /DNA_END=1506 /DNA_ORIENTATION=+